jgi:hypothetical protein
MAQLVRDICIKEVKKKERNMLSKKLSSYLCCISKTTVVLLSPSQPKLKGKISFIERVVHFFLVIA